MNLPIEVLATKIFAFAVDLDEACVGKHMLNYSLVCSQWAKCFYNVKKVVIGKDVAAEDRLHQEAFWKYLFELFPSKTEFEQKTLNYRELYMLNSIPTLDFRSYDESLIDGPSGNHQLFYSGGLKSCLLHGSLKSMQLHKLVMRRVLRDGYEKFLQNNPILETMREFFADRVVNSEKANQELTEFDVQYAKIFEERIADHFKNLIIATNSNPQIGQFIVSNGQKFVERFVYAVNFIETQNKFWEDYYFFRMRKSLYQLVLGENVMNLNIFDSALIINRDFVGMEAELEAIPQEQLGIPFPKSIDELAAFLDDNCSLILENPFCFAYHGSVDAINFIIISKHGSVGRGCYISIESSS